jgi:hypothetical protein
VLHGDACDCGGVCGSWLCGSKWRGRPSAHVGLIMYRKEMGGDDNLGGVGYAECTCDGLGDATVVRSKPRQALLFESVSEYVSPVARVDSRTQESQRGHNGLSWFGPIDAQHPAADDPYTQKHPKSGVTTVCRERFGRGLARC